jgi:hypothetical protein
MFSCPKPEGNPKTQEKVPDGAVPCSLVQTSEQLELENEGALKRSLPLQKLEFHHPLQFGQVASWPSQDKPSSPTTGASSSLPLPTPQSPIRREVKLAFNKGRSERADKID